MGTKEFTIRITEEGEIYSLYDDESPLRTLGGLEVRRASHVFFNEESQEWEIFLIDEKGSTLKLQGTFPTRKEAIDHEIEVLNCILTDGWDIENKNLFC